jgi:hypothetical protein
MVRFVLLAILKLLPAEFQIPKPARYGFFVFCPPLSGILYQIAWSDASPARHAIADSGTGCVQEIGRASVKPSLTSWRCFRNQFPHLTVKAIVLDSRLIAQQQSS